MTRELANRRDELWKIRTTAEEIFEMIGPEDVRLLREQHPGNLVTLFTQAVAQLCQIVHTPVPLYFDQALNCVRVLTRLLPFMLEAPNDTMVNHLCWSTDDEAAASEGAAKAAEDAPNGADTSSAAGTSGKPSAEEAEQREPLACLIIHAALHLLFLPSFTVDISAFEDDGEEEAPGAAPGAIKHPGAMWAPGLAVHEDVMVRSVAFDNNRIEVLRLLLADGALGATAVTERAAALLTQLLPAVLPALQSLRRERRVNLSDIEGRNFGLFFKLSAISERIF